MTPKEKAEELKFEKFGNFAELAVDEIIETLKDDWMNAPNAEALLNYWKEVKKELELL